MIEVICACGQQIRLPDEYAGKSGRCPKCKAVVNVPGADTPLGSSPRISRRPLIIGLAGAGLLSLIGAGAFIMVNKARQAPVVAARGGREPAGAAIARPVRAKSSDYGTASVVHEIPAFRRDGLKLKCLAFSPDGKLLAAGGGATEIRGSVLVDFGEVALFDVATGDRVGTLPSPTLNVLNLAFSPDGTRLVGVGLGGDDQVGGGVTVWDVVSRKPLRTIPEGAGWDVAVTPDGRGIVAGCRPPTLFDLETGAVRARYEMGIPYSLTVSPDGALVLASERVYDVRGGPRIAEFSLAGPHGVIPAPFSCEFSPDGSLLATSSMDTEHGPALWKVGTWTQIRALQAGTRCWALAFSPDGRFIVGGLETGTVIVWDVATGEAASYATEVHPQAVYSVACSPDGRTFATGDGAGTIFVWQNDDPAPVEPATTPRQDQFRGALQGR
jgi:WD40 repeat protein